MPPLAVVLVIALAALDACLVFATFRVLAMHPAPAFARGSLRREAAEMLEPKARWERWRERVTRLLAEHRRLGIVPYRLIFAVLFLPAPLKAFGVDTSALYFGPFESVKTGEAFLQTLWQVVAAAVGLTVAMVAFAFEAFLGSEQRQFGGSFGAYARETGVLLIVRLGVAALILDGAVLLGIGEGAPAGWAAMWATLIAAVTLLGVLSVIERTVRSLAPEQLVKARRRRLDRVVELALRNQLMGQAAEVILREGNDLAVERTLVASGGKRIRSGRAGALVDVRIGTLGRIAVRHASPGAPVKLRTLIGLGQEITEETEVAVLPSDLPPRLRRRVRRAFRIGGSNGDPEEADLVALIDRLHGAAKTAIRGGQTDEWREIGRLYERILLALPREATKLGLAYEGAISSPGIFGFGPMQRIEGNLLKELEAAVSIDDRELVDAISYLPFSVADKAVSLGAFTVADGMLSLYPPMYRMASG
jgi:hypothetical protein